MCPVCVKQECVYDVYRKRSFSEDIMADTIDQLCKDCFRCVQGCPKRLIHKTLNPEWEALGDDVYTPEIITANWNQAETGKIPVSGAGYGGAFSGPGFDSMWTDMSEIVRPTSDGIHGREYISTVVDIGRRPPKLRFDDRGNLLTQAFSQVRIPIPLLFDLLPFGDFSSRVWRTMAKAAQQIQTMMIVPYRVVDELQDLSESLIPYLDDGQWKPEVVSRFPLVEIPDGPGALDMRRSLVVAAPNQVVSVRIGAAVSNISRVLELADSGVGVIHLAATEKGYEPGVENPLHLKDVIREMHAALLGSRVRDEVTLVATGGIAMAEHVIKALLCGTNLVGVDIPLLISLECRVCRNCTGGWQCPVKISQIEPGWGSRRIVNLMAAWHNQLLEMMGAMGIRDARRLRGEQGRVMFREDLEADSFARFFANS